MEDILETVIDTYKKKIQEELTQKNLRAKGIWKFLWIFSGILVLGGGAAILIDLACYSINKNTEHTRMIIIILIVFFWRYVFRRVALLCSSKY